MNNEQEIKLAIIGMAEYYGIQMTENRLKMFHEDLCVLNPEQLRESILIYRSNPENKFMPLPAQLINIINPYISPLDDARDVANLIITAISKYGYTNPGNAETYIGSLGWEIVKRFGGWKHLCENTATNELGILRAQLRDFALTVQKKDQRGELEERPRLSRDVEDFEKEARLEYDNEERI